MFYDLYEHQRDALIQPCWFWLRKESEETQDEIVGEIVEVLDDWRDAQADAEGMVPINRNALAAMGGLLGYGQEPDFRKVPVASVTPLEVAGPLVRDDIDLAFKIYGEGFPPFVKLTERRGVFTVLSVIGIYSKKKAEANSLLNLNRFLTEHLIQLSMVALELAEKAFEKDRKVRQSLDANRAKALESKRIGAQERRRRGREAAIRYFKAKPNAKLWEVAAEISRADPSLGTAASVQKLITGTQAEARNLLAQ